MEIMRIKEAQFREFRRGLWSFEEEQFDTMNDLLSTL